MLTKINKNSNILHYNYNLKELFSVGIDFKMQFIVTVIYNYCPQVFNGNNTVIVAKL